MLFSILLISGCALCSWSLRTFSLPLLRLLGGFGVLFTSFLAGWLLGGEIWLGVLFVMTWALLPWLEIYSRTKNVEWVENTPLTPRLPPTSEDFPDLLAITEEFESEGCEYVADMGNETDHISHFYRLFYHPEYRIQIELSFVQAPSFAFHYCTFTCYSIDGKTQYTSSSHPFSYMLQSAKNYKIYMLDIVAGFADMLQEHLDFLSFLEVSTEQLQVLNPTDFVKNIEQSYFEQVKHNLEIGFLERKKDNRIQYTWKGMFYLWGFCAFDLLR